MPTESGNFVFVALHVMRCRTSNVMCLRWALDSNPTSYVSVVTILVVYHRAATMLLRLFRRCEFSSVAKTRRPKTVKLVCQRNAASFRRQSTSLLTKSLKTSISHSFLRRTYCNQSIPVPSTGIEGFGGPTDPVRHFFKFLLGYCVGKNCG